jgi:hypothetical protein
MQYVLAYASPHYYELSHSMLLSVLCLLLLAPVQVASMSLRKPLIAGNWKMNTDLSSATALAQEIGM